MSEQNSSRRGLGKQRSAVRIIAGRWRGRKVEFCADQASLRPTPDRVRETLFNWLAPEIVGARCLDLFAGSGVLALESLSRGAVQATVVELDAISCRSIAAAATKFGARVDTQVGGIAVHLAEPLDANIPKTDDFSGRWQTSKSPRVHTKCMTGESESSQQPRKFICEGHTRQIGAQPESQMVKSHRNSVLAVDQVVNPQIELQVVQQDVLSWLEQKTLPVELYDMVFLDPPYGDNHNMLKQCFAKLMQAALVKPGGLIYFEHNQAIDAYILPQTWVAHRQQKAGQIYYYLYRMD